MIHNILLILLIVILTAKVIGGIFEKIGLDSALGELLTGIILGPSVLGLIDAHSIEEFAIIGSVLILFVAGMKQRDIEDIYRDKPSLLLGILLLVLTGVAMSAFFYFVPTLLGVEFSLFQAIILGLAFAIVDIGVPAKVMITKGLINLPAGRIAIRSAIVNIILGLLLFTLATVFLDPTLYNILISLGGIVLFFILTAGAIFFLSKISRWVMRAHIEEAEFSLAIILVLALGYFTDLIGFSNVLGAFIAGVLISKLPFADTRSFTDKIKSLSFGLFIPLFFVWFGLEINLVDIWQNIILAVLVFLAYASVRFIITFAFMKSIKMKMAKLIGSSMISVDIESLVVLMVAMQIGIFTNNMPITLFAPSVFFSTTMIVILVTIFSRASKKIKKKNNENVSIE